MTSDHWQVGVPLAPLSTFGLGGRAAFYVRVADTSELITEIESARAASLPYTLIAGGSNVVFPDGELAGLLIHLAGEEIGVEGEVVTASAGLPLARLISTAIERGLAGLEALSGIPGSVGGAIVGNAGAYGQSISDTLESVEIFDTKTSEVKRLIKSECEFVYRDSLFKHPTGERVVLSAKFKLTPGEREELARKSQEIITIREAKYKPGIKCPGSFFKNVLVSSVTPEALAKIPAEKIRDGKIATGWLLEAVGARGMSEGDIAVAGFHGNLLFNQGSGTSGQVRTLAEKLKHLVWEKFGIKLEEEVRYLG